jgi:hypothetical protein
VKVQSDEIRDENKFNSDMMLSAFHNSFVSKQTNCRRQFQQEMVSSTGSNSQDSLKELLGEEVRGKNIRKMKKNTLI